MSDKEWLSQEMADRYTEAALDPPSRHPRYPVPDPVPVIEAAKRARLSWKEAMARVSQSTLTEDERSARQDYDESQFTIDSGEDEE